MRKFPGGRAVLFFIFLLYSCRSVPYAGRSGEELPAAENTPLYLGNPSGAVHEETSSENYLMEKSGYTISYSDIKHEANWAAWHLCSADLGDVHRSNDFRPDNALPDSWYHVQKTDYQWNLYGFERGHICPSADRTRTPDLNSETFLMTNMLPQAHDSNGIVWRDLEEYERQLVSRGNELYIFAGALGSGGISSKGAFDSVIIPSRGTDGTIIREEDGSPVLSDMKITIPAYNWKIIVILPEGTDDLARITEETQVIAVIVPNEQGCAAQGSWNQYVTTVDEVEAETGYDFLSRIDENVQNAVESRVWPEK